MLKLRVPTNTSQLQEVANLTWQLWLEFIFLSNNWQREGEREREGEKEERERERERERGRETEQLSLDSCYFPHLGKGFVVLFISTHVVKKTKQKSLRTNLYL